MRAVLGAAPKRTRRGRSCPSRGRCRPSKRTVRADRVVEAALDARLGGLGVLLRGPGPFRRRCSGLRSQTLRSGGTWAGYASLRWAGIVRLLRSRPSAQDPAADHPKAPKAEEGVRGGGERSDARDRLRETVAEIVEHDPPLYLAGGFATDNAFFGGVLKETERSARRNIRVARYASPAEEVRFGTSKLDAVLGFLEAKSGALKGRLPVDLDKLRIPIARGESTVSLGIEEATVEEIAAATRALKRKEGAAARKTSPVVAAVSSELKSAPLRTISVRLSAGKRSLGDVPLPPCPPSPRPSPASSSPTATRSSLGVEPADPD